MLKFHDEYYILDKAINLNLDTIVDMFVSFASNLDFEEMFAYVFPLHLRKNKEDCLEKITQLIHCINDEFHHSLNPLQEYILYGILDYMSDALDPEEEKSIFEENAHKIVTDVNIGIKSIDEEIEIINKVDSIHSLIDWIFEDVDFLDVGMLFQIYARYPRDFEKICHVNLDEFTELMPEDIRTRYEKLRKETLISKEETEVAYVAVKTKAEFISLIKGMMERFNYYIKHNQLYKLISRNRYTENDIQILFNFYIDLYFRNIDLDISREIDTGRGRVDFKISCGKKFKALIELKLDTNSNLDNGIQFQLPIYQIATEIDYGIYSIVCSKDDVFNNSGYYHKKANEISEKYGVQVDYYCIDVRDKKAGSKIRKLNEMNTEN